MPPTNTPSAVAIAKLERRIHVLEPELRNRVRGLVERLNAVSACATNALNCSPETSGAGAQCIPPTLFPALASCGLAPPVTTPTAKLDFGDGRCGQAVCAALYLIVEALLVRMEADRISLYLVNERTNDLQLAVNAGVGVQRPTRNSHPPLSTGLVSSAAMTGVAVNLPWVSLEDVADCPGPRAKNAIICPIRRDPCKSDGCIGVIIAVNHRRGTCPFTVDDEVALVHAGPSIAYLARQYPIDYGVFSFDFPALHRVMPPAISSSQGDSDATGTRLPDGWSLPRTQHVYHRQGPEKYIRRNKTGPDSLSSQQPVDGTDGSPPTANRARLNAAHGAALRSFDQVADYIASMRALPLDAGTDDSQLEAYLLASRREVDALRHLGDGGVDADTTVAAHLRTVHEYLNRVRGCWRQTVEQQMEIERNITRKQALVTDAQEILHRKQAKLRHIKDALCEFMEEEAWKRIDGHAKNDNA
jgi:hypothetical protein